MNKPKKIILPVFISCMFFLINMQFLNAQNIDNNLIFELEKGTVTYEKPSVEFAPGDWLLAYTRKLNTASLEPLKDKDVKYIFKFESNGKQIAEHTFTKKLDNISSYFKFNLIPNPDSGIDIKFRWDWSGKLAKALSELPAGRHPVTVLGFIEGEGKKIPIVKGQFLYDGSQGKGSLAAIAGKIDSKAGFDSQKENAKHMPAHVDYPVEITLYNNCLDQVSVKYRTTGNRESNIHLYGKQRKNVTALALESLIVSRKGKTYSGPTVSRSSKGKTITVCK